MNVFPTEPTPQYPFEVSSAFKTLKSDFESGKQQRRKIWTFPRRTIKLKFEALSQTSIDALWNFYNARYGSFEPFWFFDLFSATHGGEYVSRGTGAATIFELPSKTTTGLTVYVNNIVTPINFLSGGGDGGSDRIQFSVTGNITSSSVANPAVITTAAAHGLTTGNIVTIAGHTGSTPAISGAYTVTVLSSTTFSINEKTASGAPESACKVKFHPLS